jgi:hypothetical protein
MLFAEDLYLLSLSTIGTSDEHLSLLEHLAPLQHRLSSIIVTTPQAVALADAMKCLSFTRAVGLPVLGVIENMSGFACPCCSETYPVFSTGGGQAMAERESLTFLGALPVDTNLVTLLDGEAAETNTATDPSPGVNGSEQPSFELLARYRKTTTAKLFEGILGKIVGQLAGTRANGT